VTIALERLFAGVIATLRADVIRHIGDPYARGQAVGVIDLINNIGPGVEWARGRSATRWRRRMGGPLVTKPRVAPSASSSATRMTKPRATLN
jgi:hypothetical protein